MNTAELIPDYLHPMAQGLANGRKKIDPKFLYDQQGSELFQRITKLEEYYPTRCELKILEGSLAEITEAIGVESLIIEPGAGVGDKFRVLLRELKKPAGYIPIEIDHQVLQENIQRLSVLHPELFTLALHQDYTDELSIPCHLQLLGRRKVVFFPGSTVGNFDPLHAQHFLNKVARLVGPGGGLLIGVDRKKDPRVLEQAYNDPHGVTAAFNLNLLQRLNRECGSDFDLRYFRHEALYNSKFGRVEMHLVSLRPQSVNLGQRQIGFSVGETIHTENSYKYEVHEFEALANTAGFKLEQHWSDPEQMFTEYFFSV